MKATCKCSICKTTFTRKNNAERHLLNIHLGKGHVLTLNGQPLGSDASTWNKRPMIDLNWASRIFQEERIRVLARMALVQDYEALGNKSMTSKLIFLLEDAIENYVIRPSRSTSDLVRRLLKLDIDDDVPKPRKQIFSEVSKKTNLDSINLLEFTKKAILEDKITLRKKSW